MENFDLPILKHGYELYKTFCGYRNSVPKLDRHTLWQKCEDAILDALEGMLLASQLTKEEKIDSLRQVSVKINLLKIFIRLAKDTKALDLKKYIILEKKIDEIGKMVGGWIRSTKTN